jgi:penicillin-insensitive murein endopeptidase
VSRARKRLLLFGGLLLAWLAVLRWGNDFAIVLEDDAPSRSHGTPANGRLENGKRLPSRGDNFRAYSSLGTLVGRNAVHHAVRDAVIDAYAALASSRPDTRYVYAETGWPSGGRLRPHRTHRNGMAVDFHVPVVGADGRSRWLPSHPGNQWGYGLEFDADGRLDGLRIDFDAMVAHLLALEEAARGHGLRIEVVIFDPPLHASLFAAEGGARLRQRVRFSPRAAWVRHDEHYHVVFAPAR